jgi:hypothetical protein
LAVLVVLLLLLSACTKVGHVALVGEDIKMTVMEDATQGKMIPKIGG